MQTEAFPSFIEDFFTQLKIEGKEDSTIQRYAYDVAGFLHWLEEKNLPIDSSSILDLDKALLVSFIEFLLVEKELAWVTVKRKLSVLNRMFSFWDIQENVLSAEALALIKKDRELTSRDFVTRTEYKKLIKSIYFTTELTPYEREIRDLLVDRNASIIMLFYKYGLTLQEVVNIDMQDISFIQDTLRIPSQTGIRTIHLEKADRVLLHTYYMTIPEPVRPNDHSEQPLFVAVDFNRKTFRWDYESDSPKRIHGRSIQKMLRKEVSKAKLKPQITVHSLRNGYILNKLKAGYNLNQVRQDLGIKTRFYLKRYCDYLNSATNGAN